MTTLRSGPIDDDGGGGGDSDGGDGGSAGDTASDDERERANIPQTDPDAGGGDLSGASVDGPTESADAGDAGSPSMLRNQPLAIDREADQTGRQGTPNTTTRAAALERAGESDVTADVSLTDGQLSGGGQTGQTTRTDLAGAVTDDEQQAALRPNQALAEDLQEQGAEAGDVGDFDIPGPVSEGGLRSASTEFVSQFPGRVSKATQLGVPSVSFGPGGVPMASEESADTLTTPASEAGPGGVRGAVLSGTGQAVDPFGAALQGKEIAEAGAYAVAGDGSAGERAGVLAGKGLTLGERTVEQARERPVQTAAAAGVGTLVGTSISRASPVTVRSAAGRVASGARRVSARASDVRTRLETGGPRRTSVSGLTEGERGMAKLTGRTRGQDVEIATRDAGFQSGEPGRLPSGRLGKTIPDADDSGGPSVSRKRLKAGLDEQGAFVGSQTYGSGVPRGGVRSRPQRGFDIDYTETPAGVQGPEEFVNPVTGRSPADRGYGGVDMRGLLGESGAGAAGTVSGATRRQEQLSLADGEVGGRLEPSFAPTTPGVEPVETGSQGAVIDGDQTPAADVSQDVEPVLDIGEAQGQSVTPFVDTEVFEDVAPEVRTNTEQELNQDTEPFVDQEPNTDILGNTETNTEIGQRTDIEARQDLDTRSRPRTDTEQRVRDPERTRTPEDRGRRPRDQDERTPPRDIDLDFDRDGDRGDDRLEELLALKSRFEFTFADPLEGFGSETPDAGEWFPGGDGDG